MSRHLRGFRAGLIGVAIVAVPIATAACSSSESASSTTSTTVASTTSTTEATSTTSSAAPAGGVDCAATEAAFNKVRSVLDSVGSASPEQLVQDLQAADRQVSVIADQATAAGVPTDTVQTYVQNQQEQLRIITQAASEPDAAAALQTAQQQAEALSTPEVTQAETQISQALKTACPGIAEL